MGTVVPFPGHRRPAAFGPEDHAALERLVVRLRGRGAIRWEAEGPHAFVLGAEDETLLIVAKGTHGITVSDGFGHAPLWRGDRLPGFA